MANYRREIEDMGDSREIRLNTLNDIESDVNEISSLIQRGIDGVEWGHIEDALEKIFTLSEELY